MVHTSMDEALFEPTLYIVKGMCILDNDGNRILAKYYDKNILTTTKEQKAFEKNLFNKTHRANAEIIMLDGLTCVYKSNVDLFFYVMGSSHENEVSISIHSYSEGTLDAQSKYWLGQYRESASRTRRYTYTDIHTPSLTRNVEPVRTG
ncbi:clathrin adaptor complex small chain domain-containing protein [Phthorimaea operculella]|nr:clathrin adaptor complex small chain domain-containing protein [Phthorimaea operculella]